MALATMTGGDGMDMAMKPKSGTKKLDKLFGASAYDAATETNYEGAPTFERGSEEQLVRVLMTGTFEQTFYASDIALAKEALAIFRQFARDDPHFLTQAVLYARAEGLMRTAPITALVVLSAAESADAKELFRRAFPQVIRTPGDLQDFLSLCRQKTLRGMGKAVTHAAQRWLAEISQYHAIKYGSEHQAMSLRDCYRLARPTLSGEASAIARYLVRSEVAPELTQIAGYEELKREAAKLRQSEQTTNADGAANADGVALDPTERARIEAHILALIAEHRLPWEVVVTQVTGSAAVWEAMMRQMPYMAMLRNLNNAVKYGVTDNPEALEYLAETLADSARVASSKQFPFAFYSALKALKAEGEAGDRLRDALSRALEQSFVNMPDLGQRVLIANDISGSMSMHASARGKMTMSEIAGIFAAAAFKKAADGKIVSFDTQTHPRDVTKALSLAKIAAKISGFGGGTSLSAPLEYAFGQARAQVYDVALFFTDSESWYDHLLHNRGVLDRIREYRARVNPDLKCFFVQLLPYKHAVAPQDEPGCYYIYGWSASILTYIASVVDGGLSQVERVRQVSVL